MLRSDILSNKKTREAIFKDSLQDVGVQQNLIVINSDLFHLSLIMSAGKIPDVANNLF